MRPHLFVLVLACAGCSIDTQGTVCPTASPNGEEGVLYIEGDGYLHDGLYQHLIIPSLIPGHELTLDGTAIVFDPPVCERDPRGVIIDRDGVPNCEVNVHTEPTTKSCKYDDVVYDFDGATIEATGRGNHVVLASEITATEAHVQVKCDVALSGADNDTTITIRGPNGKVRYRDRVELICLRADTFRVYWDEVVGRPSPPTLEGTVHVGEEFFMRYTMSSSTSGVEQPVLGNGMVPVGPDPAFEIVGYEAFPQMAIRMHMRALKPATRPLISAGQLTTEMPVVIVP
jgi:hypothetical protein